LMAAGYASAVIIGSVLLLTEDAQANIIVV